MFGSIPTQSVSGTTRYRQTGFLGNPQQLVFKRKVNHIARLNLKDQDKDICACEECIYGRQLNRKRLVHLELSKDSSYRRHYRNKSLVGGNSPLFSIDYDRMQRDSRVRKSVVEKSSYLSSYNKGASTKPVRARPTDEIHFKGPVKGYSSYKEYFPCFKNNANPYVKPVEVRVPNTIKMNTNSIYRSNFSGQKSPPSETGKNPDQLHIGLPWTGRSTYRQLFQGLAVGQKSRGTESRETASRQLSDSRLNEGNFKHQYETIYRNDFRQQSKKCLRGEGSSLNPLLASLEL